MPQPDTLINELEDALSNGSAERRTKTFLRITDLFVFGSSHFSDDHVALFDNIFNRLIADTLQDAPVLSITLDNDISFQKHRELSELVGTVVFFCNPFHSWEKGTVENRNRCVRRYAPKKTNFSLVRFERLIEIETILRTRYMKCLNFKTPQEACNDEIKKWQSREKKKLTCDTLITLPASIIQNNRCSA